ncbi:hypothetical protein [Yoonia sp.]
MVIQQFDHGMMTVRQLRFLTAVYETQSFLRAADISHLAQSMLLTGL